ncbi:Hypothetical predicted protein [Paramuricea clavata]|uniref:Uncharacterized protein n=1 Tax=Paramuricea clavata TaxID=317549 RepID=A0A6S7FUB6_PARCT|nr:Hypothetical predicted protein [Paramuricea clavata]
MILNKVPRFFLSTLRNSRPLRPVYSKCSPLVSSKAYCSSLEKKSTITEETSERRSTLPQHHLSYVDKVTLKLFGNIKGEIPNEVSYAVMEKADSKRRIAVNLFLVAFCGFGSMLVVYNVKKNLKNDTQQNIYAQNSQRYQEDKKS